jgi:hypothetical protein
LPPGGWSWLGLRRLLVRWDSNVDDRWVATVFHYKVSTLATSTAGGECERNKSRRKARNSNDDDSMPICGRNGARPELIDKRS